MLLQMIDLILGSLFNPSLDFGSSNCSFKVLFIHCFDLMNIEGNVISDFELLDLPIWGVKKICILFFKIIIQVIEPS